MTIVTEEWSRRRYERRQDSCSAERSFVINADDGANVMAEFANATGIADRSEHPSGDATLLAIVSSDNLDRIGYRLWRLTVPYVHAAAIAESNN